MGETGLRRLGAAAVAVVLAVAGCTAAQEEATPTTSPTTTSTTSTTVAPTTTIDPREVARLDGTWFVTYRVVDAVYEGTAFDDFAGVSEVGDIGVARVWILEHLCDEGVCDAHLDSRLPEAPEEEFVDNLFFLAEDGTYSWDPESTEAGTCVVDDGSVFEDSYRRVTTIDVQVVEVDLVGDGWLATELAGTRVVEAEPVEEAAAAGCEIGWRATYEVKAIRVDPDDPVPALLPPGSAPVVDRLAYAAVGESAGIWTVAPDGSDPLLVLEVAGVEGLAWSPDATHLAFSDGDGDLWVAAADGSNPIRLTWGTLPAWSPDERWLAFIRPRRDGQGEEVWTISTMTGETEKLTGWGEEGMIPAWVDENSLVIASLAPDETETWLWLREVETGETSSLISGDQPSISPDGSLVAFIWSGQVWVVGVDGSDVRQLTDGPNDSHPTWSPDGRQVAFIRGSSVWAVEVDGSGLRMVVPVGFQPAWSPVRGGEE